MVDYIVRDDGRSTVRMRQKREQEKRELTGRREQRELDRMQHQKEKDELRRENEQIRMQMQMEQDPNRRKELKQEIRLNKLREKDLRTRTRFQGIGFEKFGIGVGSMAEQTRHGLTKRLKRLDDAYHNIDKKEHKFNLDKGIGGIGHRNFDFKVPKLKTYELGWKDLELSFGDKRFDNKSNRRKKYYRKRKYGNNKYNYKKYKYRKRRW